MESPHRVVIFSSGESGVPAILIRASVAALSARSDLELVGICLPKSKPYVRVVRRHLASRAVQAVRSFLGRSRGRPMMPPLPIDLERLTRRQRCELLIPPEGNINHPEFVARLRDEIRAVMALSFYCFQKFGPELLEVFSHAVNYHNGLLPEYRGLQATAWSRYRGEKETGFTFHRMTREMDGGPVLVRGTIPNDPDRSTSDLNLSKALAAAALLPRVLSAMVDGDPGTPQGTGGRYFSREDLLSMTRIPDPAVLSKVELDKRLMAFEWGARLVFRSKLLSW
jgi:methionyl-tRNA formyltransferase